MILVSPLETATPETPRMLRSAGEMKTKSVSNRKVQLAFESAILTLLVAGAISCRRTVVCSESDRRLSHAVLENVQDSVFAMESSESSSRRVASTGKNSYLESYCASPLRIEQDQATIHNLMVDNPEQPGQPPAREILTLEKIPVEIVTSLRRARGLTRAILILGAAVGARAERRIKFLASVTFTALCDSAGHLRGFSGISHDLSERKESEAKYRGLLEAAPDAMVVVDQCGEILLLNVQAEKQFGYRRDELEGQPVKNIIPEGFAERLIADALRSVEDALAQQIGMGIELNGRRKGGSEFPIEIMLSPRRTARTIPLTLAVIAGPHLCERC